MKTLFNYIMEEDIAKYLTDSPVFAFALKEAMDDHKKTVYDALIYCEEPDEYFLVDTKHTLSILTGNESMCIYIDTTYASQPDEYNGCCMFETRIECAEEDR